ncbi:MAG: DoxX family membrane protein [Pseudobdellovibrio sp.]
MGKKITLGARIILGLIFFVFGLNFFLNFIPTPPPPESMKNMMEGMMKLSYLLPVVKTLEVACGALLLLGLFIPLTLLILAPIVVNIAIIHFVYEPSGAPMAAGIIVLMLILAWSHRKVFSPLLKIKH